MSKLTYPPPRLHHRHVIKRAVLEITGSPVYTLTSLGPISPIFVNPQTGFSEMTVRGQANPTPDRLTWMAHFWIQGEDAFGRRFKQCYASDIQQDNEQGPEYLMRLIQKALPVAKMYGLPLNMHCSYKPIPTPPGMSITFHDPHDPFHR